MAYFPFERAALEAMALAQAGMKSPTPAPVRPPVRTPAASKPFVPPTAPVTSGYADAKAYNERELAAAAAQNQAKLAIADRAALPYQSLAKSAESLPGQITAGYDAAAGRSEAFTSAYSQAFRDESAKLQASNGAENRGSGLGDALAFMGSLPAQGYRDSGSGLAEAARFLPTTVGLRGLDAVTEARSTENTAYAKLLSELRSAGGKRLLDAAQQDRTFGLDKEKLSYQQWKDTRDANADKSKRAYEEWKDNRDFKYQQGQDAIGMLEKQAAQLSESGLLFQYNPATKTVEPVMGEDGAQIQTTPGITASQGAVRLRLAVQKQLQDTTRTVWEETPGGGFRDTGVPTGGQKNADRTWQQGQDRLALTRGSQAIARANLGMREIEFLQSQSPYVLTRDNKGNIVEYRDKKGNTVQSALGRTVDASQWTKVKALSDAYTDSTGIVYLPQKQLDGSIVATPVMNGKKPLLTKAGQERQQGDWGRLTPDARFKITANLANVAKSSFAGVWESKDPAFRNADGTARTTEDKSKPELGWSIPNGEESGYINHHPTMTFGEALEDALILGAPYDVTVKALLGAGFKGGERGTPFSAQQRQSRMTQAAKTVQRPASLQAILSGITMPIGNNPDAGSIVRVATLAGIPSEFIPVFNALVQQESGGTQTRNGSVLTSSEGALGLTQLMPSTAKGLGVNPLDPTENLVGGAMYFKNALEKWGDVRLALAAYNAGPGKVQEWLDKGVPFEKWYPETRNYVTTILGNVGG